MRGTLGQTNEERLARAAAKRAVDGATSATIDAERLAAWLAWSDRATLGGSRAKTFRVDAGRYWDQLAEHGREAWRSLAVALITGDDGRASNRRDGRPGSQASAAMYGAAP